MSRTSGVGPGQGPISERALQISWRLEHRAKDEVRPRRDPGKQPPPLLSRERVIARRD